MKLVFRRVRDGSKTSIVFIEPKAGSRHRPGCLLEKTSRRLSACIRAVARIFFFFFGFGFKIFSLWFSIYAYTLLRHVQLKIYNYFLSLLKRNTTLEYYMSFDKNFKHFKGGLDAVDFFIIFLAARLMSRTKTRKLNNTTFSNISDWFVYW